jgi:hypothetical protein
MRRIIGVGRAPFGARFSSRGRMRKTIGNPLLAVLAQLGRQAPRLPQVHENPLLVETI